MTPTTALRAFWIYQTVTTDETDDNFREFTVLRAEIAIRHRIAALRYWEQTDLKEANRAALGPYQDWKRLCSEQVGWKAIAFEALLSGDLAEYRYAYRQTRLVLRDLEDAQAALWPVMAIAS